MNIVAFSAWTELAGQRRPKQKSHKSNTVESESLGTVFVMCHPTAAAQVEVILGTDMVRPNEDIKVGSA